MLEKYKNQLNLFSYLPCGLYQANWSFTSSLLSSPLQRGVKQKLKPMCVCHIIITRVLYWGSMTPCALCIYGLQVVWIMVFIYFTSYFFPKFQKLFSTECLNFGKRSYMIIFGSLMTTFEVSNIFWGSCDSSKNWLEP